MTQWFRDFSEYSEGDLSSVGAADWSVSTLTGSWYVIVDSTGGAAGEDACVADNDVSSDANAFAWFDASATTGDIECYCKFSNDGSYDTNVGFGPAIMQTDNQCYALAANGATDTRLLRFGTAGTASQVLGSTTFALSASTVYHAIVGRSGTSIYAYIWADGDSQPGSPQISTTNTVLGSVSGAIFCRDGSMAPQRTTAFGVGTAGDAAPQSGGGGGGTTVNLTGVSATGAAGDFTVTGAASVTVTGASSTGAVGTITATGAAIAAIVGVASTGAVGSPTVTGAASTALTGASATGSAGTLTATGAANITITGVSSTGQVGSLTVTVGGAVTVGLTGVSATGRVGVPTVTGAASVNVTGASTTGQAGTITATVGGTTVILTGAGATGRVGTLSITGAANIAMVGASATGAAGSLSVTIPGSEAHIAATITITPAIGGTLTLQPAIDGDITIN